MAAPDSSTIQTPLIQTQTPPLRQEDVEVDDTQLSKSLDRLETFLRFFGFCQYSFLSFSLSWICFLLLGVALPILIIQLTYCSNCEKYEIESFELEILISQSLVAVISLICVSHNLRKYGVRKFLFVDRQHGHLIQFRREYLQKIHGFFKLLGVWIIPCFLLKAARQVVHIVYVHHSWWQSVGIIVVLLVSWTYSTIIYLSGSLLFHLVCNLQVIHFENYGRLLERDLDVSLYIEEHVRLKHHLSKISHRFRIFLLLEFLIVTATQVMALLETTGNYGIINFINGGDFAVASIVELVGIVICLNAAAKITHRAQGLGSVASRWHASVTCSSNSVTQMGINSNGGSVEAANSSTSIPTSYSESDLESVEYVPMATNTQLASYMTMYHKRQAFVTYLQSNPGGVTIFGWTIDRVLINTIFFVEMSLVLFVLGKTITWTTK
ncbi:uncharacterized protein LOC123211263 isoform X1 [Mangifera indica]|uniref:uncharacterized protein LOC123211263 isoform X1 n=1 Tax=Mangifera indica TaxID=29780 RepID=UPI001CFB40ED|nr:uncharacterized protein LOC123211263 isoform X1 [Mangifera indica]